MYCMQPSGVVVLPGEMGPEIIKSKITLFHCGFSAAPSSLVVIFKVD